MQRDPVTAMRNRAYELADTGEYMFWTSVRDVLVQEGADSFVIRLLEGDRYFNFRLRQRMKAANTRHPRPEGKSD